MKKEETSKQSFFKAAFTLIELLVVIAIIGILSGLIIVTLDGMTQKATIAKAQVFSNSLRNSLLMNIAGEWKMDEGSGTAVNDTWTRTNNGTLYNFANTTAGYGDTNTDGWMSSSNCISGPCLKFDGVDDYVDFGNKASLHFSNNFTIEAWVNISSTPVNQDCMIIGDYNGNYKGYKFSIDQNRKVYFLVGRASDLSTVQILSIQILDLNKWYHVVASYDGRVNVFLNGSKTMGGVYAPIEAETANIIMGKAQWWGKYFPGLIEDVRVYNAAVPTSQIKEQYYAGLNKLLLSGGISKEEYLQRLNTLASK